VLYIIIAILSLLSVVMFVAYYQADRDRNIWYKKYRDEINAKYNNSGKKR
jgi:hypothetical protein